MVLVHTVEAIVEVVECQMSIELAEAWSHFLWKVML